MQALHRLSLYLERAARVGGPSGKGKTVVARRSKEALKIGTKGEKLVVGYEKRRLLEAGRGDLAEKVEWLANQNKTPGWDIDSFELDGSPLRIEVKSSSGRISSLGEKTPEQFLGSGDWVPRVPT